MTETEILQLISVDPEKAFELIYRDWYADLSRYAYRFLKCQEEADDLVQACLVKLWDKRNQLNKVETLRGYLYRMVYHASLNRLDHLNVRHQYREHVMMELEDLKLQALSDTSDKFEHLHAALNQLPEKNRMVFKMHYFEGYKHKEIAERLNISDRTVETHIVKGLKKLRLYLGKKTTLFFILCTGLFKDGLSPF